MSDPSSGQHQSSVCWESQTFSSGSLLLPKCVRIKSTARLTDLSRPGGRADMKGSALKLWIPFLSQQCKREGEVRKN